MFLLYTVSVLSRSCSFVNEVAVNLLANDKLCFKLDDEELSMIINYEAPLIWKYCDKKLTRNSVAKMYAHISFNNKNFSLGLIVYLLIGLQKSFFLEMKYYERALVSLLMIKDDYQEDRAKKFV
jgi:hypothetical protein